MSQHAVHSDPDILGGTPVFVGTRVPFHALMDYLEDGWDGMALPTVEMQLAPV